MSCHISHLPTHQKPKDKVTQWHNPKKAISWGTEQTGERGKLDLLEQMENITKYPN